MTSNGFSAFLRMLNGAGKGRKNQSGKTPGRKPQRQALGTLEILEDRSVPATLYLGLAANYTITNDTGTAGLTSGDTVTWTDGGSKVTGLTFGTSAFTSVSSAVGKLGNSDTLKVASANYGAVGNVNVSQNGATFDIPAGTSGFSLTLTTTSSNLTMTGNGTVNVTGSSGSNTLTGNSADNNFNGAAGTDTIWGNGGNDTITGGTGVDTARYNNNRANYSITVSGSTVTVTDSSASNNDGTDTLTGVEKVQFNDGAVRAVPSSLDFNVGTSGSPVATSLVLGSVVLDGNSAQGSPSVTLTLSGGTTATDGNLTGGASSGITISGSGTGTLTLSASTWSALNTYLNSGLVSYNSKTNTARTITITAGDGLSVSGYCALSPVAAPSFTSASSTSVTYGNSVSFTVSATGTPAPTFSITTGSLPSGISLNSSTGAMTGSTAAGTYNFTITATSGGQTATQAFTLTVNKVALTVTAAGKSKTYGDSDPTLTYSVTTGALVGSDAFTGALSRTSGENVGSYAINQGTLSAGSNYTVTYVGANLTVSAKALTVTAAAKSKTYGDSDPTLTYSVTTGALVGSDAFTGALTRATGENAGTYAINQGTLSAGSNYSVSYVSANLTVNKATLSITADAKSKTYGDSDPSLTYAISGLKNSDTSSVVTGALTREAGENAGTYAINQGTVAASSNYNVSYTGANLTVNKATLSITADAKSKTYGDTDPSLTFAISGLKNSDTSSVVTGALSRATGENVGTYAINQGTVTASSNYNVTFTGANLTVGKAALTITANQKFKTYGSADPSLTYSVSGLTNGDTSSIVTGALSRVSGENAGNYAINQGSVSATNNYTVTFHAGQLTINKAILGITADPQSKTYGDSDPSLTYVISGLKNGDTSSVVTGALTRTTGEIVGTYAINQGTVAASSNYNVTFTGANLTVNKAALSITADAKAKTYGDSDPSLTYVISGLKNGDTSSVVAGALTRATGENVGTYAISQGTVAASSNYNVTFTGADLTVGKRSVTVTASDVSGTYGTAALGNGFGVSNMAFGETIGAVSFATNAPTSGAGKYQAGSWSITPSAATGGSFDAGNYNVSYANGTFTVAKATLNVSATGSNKVYNGNASATVTLSDDHLGGDAVVVTPASVNYSDANVGFAKTITASGLVLSGSDAGNYNLASSSVTASGNITGSGIVNNVLTIVGTGNDDEVIIALNPKNTAQLNVIWTVNAVTTYTPYTISGLNGVNIYGADGNDKLTMNAEVPLAVNFYGNNGNDTLRGGNYNDNLFGNDGNDTLYGSLGNDYLDGGNGSDILNGQDGNDTLIANASDPNETLINTLDGGNGSDTLIGANGDDNLTGGTNNALDGADTIIGNGGNDKIFGGAGNDTISGGDGVDTIDGGDNNDTINGGNGNDILNGSAGDDTINGEAGDDTINAGDGNDTVNGGDGNDIITGQAGDDTLNGGNGNDNIQGGDGNDTITAGDGNNYILGQAGNDSITVGNGNNIVVGGLGNDTIIAGNGNNILIGGAGLDTITAGNGSNLIIGNSTTYDASETNLRTMQTEWLRTDITTAQKKTNLTVTGVNGVKLVQGQTVIDDLFADVINAGTGDNWIWF